MATPSIKRNFLYNSAYQLLLVVAPLITTPWLARTIGAEGNGIFTYTQSIANYFVLAATLGMANYGVRTIAECGDDRAARSIAFWETMLMNVTVGVVVLIAYIAYGLLFGGEYGLLWALWGMWVLSSVVDTSWLFFGCQEFRMPTIRNFATKATSIAVILVLVRGAGDTWIYVLAISGSYLASSLLLWPFVRRYVDWARPTVHGALARLKPNLMLFVPMLAISLYILMDKVMLGAIAGVTEVGLYDYAEKISKMPMAMITALGAVVLPKMSEVIAAGRKEEGIALVGDTMWFMLASAMALSFGIAAVAPEFVPVFFGGGFERCVGLMRALCCIVPLICATNVMGIQYLVPCHRDKDFTVSVSVGAVANVIVNLFAIAQWGAMGATVATIASEVIVLVCQAWMVRTELPLVRMLLGAMPFVVIGATMFVAIRMVSIALGVWAQSVIGLAILVVWGAAVYLVCSYLWCFASKSQQLKRILPRVVRW